MEPIVSSETSAIRTQTPGNYPKRNNLHLEHGESLRTKKIIVLRNVHFVVQCTEVAAGARVVDRRRAKRTFTVPATFLPLLKHFLPRFFLRLL